MVVGREYIDRNKNNPLCIWGIPRFKKPSVRVFFEKKYREQGFCFENSDSRPALAARRVDEFLSKCTTGIGTKKWTLIKNTM